MANIALGVIVLVILLLVFACFMAWGAFKAGCLKGERDGFDKGFEEGKAVSKEFWAEEKARRNEERDYQDRLRREQMEYIQATQTYADDVPEELLIAHGVANYEQLPDRVKKDLEEHGFKPSKGGAPITPLLTPDEQIILDRLNTGGDN